MLFDVRDGARTLRISRHADVWVLSTWIGGDCVSSFRLGRDAVADLIAELARGLAVADDEWSPAKLAGVPTGRRRRFARLLRL